MSLPIALPSLPASGDDIPSRNGMRYDVVKILNGEILAIIGSTDLYGTARLRQFGPVKFVTGVFVLACSI